MATPLSQRELDAVREDADRFIAELDEEAYLHFAGHKATYDLVPIYERHAELTKLDTALNIGATVNGGRTVRELWRFACEGYLGNFVKAEEEKIAEAETNTVKCRFVSAFASAVVGRFGSSLTANADPGAAVGRRSGGRAGTFGIGAATGSGADAGVGVTERIAAITR